MGVLVKEGVDFGPALHPAGARILDAIKASAGRLDFDIVITSARDGVHSPNSVHYSGEAFDLRTNTLLPSQKAALLTNLQVELYREPRMFFAFLEHPGEPNEHIHCQRRAGQTYSIVDYLANH